jgi:hypothetical protein
MKIIVQCPVKDVSEPNFGIGSFFIKLLPPRMAASRLHGVTYKKTVILETVFISIVVTVL